MINFVDLSTVSLNFQFQSTGQIISDFFAGLLLKGVEAEPSVKELSVEKSLHASSRSAPAEKAGREDRMTTAPTSRLATHPTPYHTFALSQTS
jgi:hypothetical protein